MQNPIVDHSNLNANLELLGTAGFSVSSRVALQLGRESISSSVTAIVELVKNAFDADARTVCIRFADTDDFGPVLVIEDTGLGMAKDDLMNHWLVIGTPHKLEKKRTAKERTVTGEKGLGRLGLDRLCGRTLIDSFQKGISDGVRLDVRWGKYERNFERLESVQHELYRLPQPYLDPVQNTQLFWEHGTRLSLFELKDGWDKESVAALRRELALLVSPFQASNDFFIEIDTGKKWPELEGSVVTQEPLLNLAMWKVTAALAEDATVTISMTSERHAERFDLEPTKWSDFVKKQGALPLCGPLRFEFYFFLRRDTQLGSKNFKSTEIGNFLDFNQGVRIYRDNFRVKPYGEPNGHGDWLRLAYRRIQSPEGVAQNEPGRWRVGYNQIVGAVFISHENNPELNDQTNREGLLQGGAFDHLNVFSLKVIQFFETNHQRFEIERKPERIPAEKAEDHANLSLRDANEAINALKVLAEQIPRAPKNDNGEKSLDKDEITRAIDEVRGKLESASVGFAESARLYKESEEQKNTMANLASLGILAAAFGHETLDWIGTVNKNVQWLKKTLSTEVLMIAPDIQREIDIVIGDTSSEALKVRKFARFTLGNLNREKRKRKKFDLAEVVKRVFDAFDEVLKIQRNTAIDLVDIPATHCLISGYEMDWESVVVNLLTNASWALEDVPKEKRRIKASIVDDGDNWIFQFDDSGVGLEKGTEKMIFMPAFSTKRNKRGETTGTGMGLFIVKSFVEDHSNGAVSASVNGVLGGASFTICVPKAV